MKNMSYMFDIVKQFVEPTEMINDEYCLRVWLISGNSVLHKFKSEAERENFISMLFYENGRLTKNVERLII